MGNVENFTEEEEEEKLNQLGKDFLNPFNERSSTNKTELDQLYLTWHINNPDKVSNYESHINAKSDSDIQEILIDLIKKFEETSPDLFNDIFDKYPLKKKEKCDQMSVKYREEGNYFYQKKQLKDALRSYNCAIKWADSDTILALAFANRSATLFQLKEYKACIRDVDRAIGEYPSKMSYKLYERRAKSCLNLQCYQAALDDFQKSQDLILENMQEKDSKLNSMLKEIEKSMTVCESKMNFSKVLDLEINSNLVKLKSTNPSIPSLSDAVKIDFNSERGRHAVALRKIECGEFIFVENSQFNSTNFESRNFICSNCMNHTIDMIPGPLNPTDLFCSKNCLNVAMNSYHPKESQMLDISTQLNLTKSEWDIAFHTILRKPLSFFLQQKDKIFSNVNQKYGSILDNGNTYGSDDYQTIYNLNTSQSGRIHQKAFTAWFYIQCLRKLNYFSDEISNIISNEITEEELYIAKLLFHFMNAANTNAIEIGSYMIENQNSSMMDGKIITNGVRLNPLVALFNHSCDPNIIRMQNCGNTIGIANRTIQKNEEICIIYYDGYWEADLKTRQGYLSNRYQFQCNCQPCIKNWPIIEDLPKNFNDLLPQQLKIENPDPKMLMRYISQFQKLGSSISLEQKNGNYEKAYAYCIEFLQILEKTLHRPHFYFVMAEKSLYKLANILYGIVIK